MKITEKQLRKIIKEELLNEYKDIEKEVASDMMNIHIGLGNTMRNILIDLTNQKHGDKEKIPNAKKANQQIAKVRQEFKKLYNIMKALNFGFKP